MSEESRAVLECKICLDTAAEPVATLCGHVFCWGCLFEWSEVRGSTTIPCPSCNSEVIIEKVVPLYTSVEQHRRAKPAPKRPRPQAPPFQNQEANAGFQFHFTPFGFGFVFGGGRNNAQAGPNQPQNRNTILMFLPFLLMFLPTIMGFIQAGLSNIFSSVWTWSPSRTTSPYSESFFDAEELGELFSLLFFVVIAVATVFYFKKYAPPAQPAQNAQRN